MSEPSRETPLSGAEARGYVTIAEATPPGMITLRGDLQSAALAKAVKAATGQPLPAPRQISGGLMGGAAWASPDELLLFTPRDETPAKLQALETALKDQHSLLADVSDMRAVFRLEGGQIREVLAKLTPADLAPEALPVGEFRRSHLGQVAAAFWFETPQRAHLVCFRSVAGYAFDLLREAARPGGEVGVFPEPA